MKRSMYVMAIALFTLGLSTSCQKDETNTSADVTSEVADEIASSLASPSTGITDEMADFTENVEDNYSSLKSAVPDTLYAVDTLFTKSNNNGATFLFNYSYDLAYGLVYESGNTYAYYNGSLSGSYDGTRFSGSEDRTNVWNLSGFAVSATVYTLNGTIERDGSTQSKIGAMSYMKSASEITVTNVKMNKGTYDLEGGELNWHISGTVAGQSFDYTASVVFSGNGTAELTLEGEIYIINLTTGTIE